MLYQHYSEIPSSLWRWENFSPDEPGLACPCCGEFFLDFASMDGLQAIRTWLGKPIKLNSGHRCPIHNAHVGGAPLSCHKWFAADINLHGHNRHTVHDFAQAAGFTGFEFYKTFLHVDRGRPRFWYSQGAKEIWNSSTI